MGIPDYNHDLDIDIPEELRSIIPGYLSRRDAELVEMRKASQNQDFEVIKRIAHNLKGNGAGYGFYRISDLGAKLMESCSKQDSQGTANLIEELSDEISRLKAILL